MANDYDDDGNLIKPETRLTNEEFSRASQAMRDAKIAFLAAHRATEDARTVLANCEINELQKEQEYKRSRVVLESGIE